MEVGKLYICEEFFLMLYPDQETASTVKLSGAATREGCARSAAYWSNQLDKPISYVYKNIPLLVLNSKENFYEVLAGDKKGWNIFKDRLNIKEIL